MSTPQYDWLAHHASYAPDSLAQHDLHSDRRFSYRQMHQRVEALAGWLRREAKVAVGDRVATLCHNSSDNNEILFSAPRTGAIHLPLNWRLTVPELEFILRDAEPRVLIHSEEFTDRALELQRRCAIPTLLCRNDGKPSGYEQAIAANIPLREPARPRLEDVWVLMYTSGTTGKPKGAQLTYQAHLFNCVNATMKTQLTSNSVGLTYLPQFHVGGICLYAIPLLHLGGSVRVMRQFDPLIAFEQLSRPEHGITHTFGVPTNFLLISQLPGFESARFDHLVSVGIGGAPSPLALLETWAKHGVLFQHGWGMTETCTIGTMLSRERALDKIGSAGQAVLHGELKIVDSQGHELPAGQTGELLMKGPTITPGYWRRPEVNARALADGWLRTGDAAYVDQEGFYFIVDRYKDMYISGGENVYPAEVEDVLYRLDGIAETAVIGVPDERWGEVGRAFVVLKADAKLDEATILDHCTDNLARYKVPRTIRFVKELPHNATGKVTKHELPRD
jgi:fatty-acyl-CoA synthase